MGRNDAARTAAESLSLIEQWSRKTFIASAVTAACSAVIALAVLFGLVEYIRFKMAMASAADRIINTKFEFPRAMPVPKDAQE